MKVLLLVDDADEQTLYRHHLEAGVEDLTVVAHAPSRQGPLPSGDQEPIKGSGRLSARPMPS